MLPNYARCLRRRSTPTARTKQATRQTENCGFSLCLTSSTRQHWFGTDNRPTMRDKISLSVSNKVVRSLIAGDSKPSGPVQGDGVGHACRTRHQPGLWLYAPAQRTFGWHLSLLIARPKRLKTKSSNLLRLLGSFDRFGGGFETNARSKALVCGFRASRSQVIIGSEGANEGSHVHDHSLEPNQFSATALV
ncbi:hypothetical protein ABIC07_008933 [Bradyrhizobium sp. RT9a]